MNSAAPGLHATRLLPGFSALLVFIALAFSAPLYAQVSLPSVNLGQTTFEDGIAFPGLMVETLPEYYHAGQWKNATGGTIAGDNTLTTVSTLNHVALISHRRLLGGYAGAEAVLVLADANPQTSFGPDSRTAGVSDLTMAPLIQWTNNKLFGKPYFQRICFDFSVPTGKYNKNRAVNIGNNAFVFNPYYAFTYVFAPRWEASARLHYLYNGENDSPVGQSSTLRNVQAGQAFHQNYMVSYKVVDGVRFGFNGYALEQFTDHRENGIALANSRERVFGLGPGVELGGKGTWLWVNAYIETGAQNRPQGAAVSFDFRKVFSLERKQK
ncbi:MAG: transporter [Acidobacteriota bacterium]|nr:transporter [Acidobacteriota bacterium]